jgi:hypothetical protein
MLYLTQKFWSDLIEKFKMNDVVKPCLSDPYAEWRAESDQADGQGMDGSRMAAAGASHFPVLIQSPEDKDKNAQLYLQIKKSRVEVGISDASSIFKTVLVPLGSTAYFLAQLDKLNIRWEQGAPFFSPPDKGWSEGVKPGFVLDVPISKKRTVIGIIDYGCAFINEKVLTVDKFSTRVLALWDQHEILFSKGAALSGLMPLHWDLKGVPYGSQTRRDSKQDKPFFGSQLPPKKFGIDEYCKQFINADGILDEERCYANSGYAAAQAPATHGTYIMDFAAGVPGPLNSLSPEWAGNDKNIAEADIVFVQLPRIFQGSPVSGLLRTYVLDAIQYIFACAGDKANVVVNLSYGANVGPHDGSSLIEQAIDHAIDSRRRVTADGIFTEVVVAAGNTRISDLHAHLALPTVSGAKHDHLLFGTIPDNPTLQFIECWLDGADLSAVKLVLIPPGAPEQDAVRISVGSGAHLPINKSADVGAQQFGHITAPQIQQQGVARVLIGLYPTSAGKDGRRAPVGTWSLRVESTSDKNVVLNAYCEKDDPTFASSHGPRQIRFFQKNDADKASHRKGTLSSLAHGKNTVVVGGLVLSEPDTAVEYSSEGPGRGASSPNHEIYAPSDENHGLFGLPGAGVFGQSKVRYSGTSVAAAVMTRRIASGFEPKKTSPTRPTKRRDPESRTTPM